MCPLTRATHITQHLPPTPPWCPRYGRFHDFFGSIFTLNGQGLGFNSLEQHYNTRGMNYNALGGNRTWVSTTEGYYSTMPPGLGGRPQHPTPPRATSKSFEHQLRFWPNSFFCWIGIIIRHLFFSYTFPWAHTHFGQKFILCHFRIPTTPSKRDLHMKHPN